ncbi:MAG: MMPL family transporter, partial [Pseudomonadales bacterium]|nr:MMPL family transporter [Pseudomonadales bacterium]
HGFRKQYIETGNPVYAVETTLLSTGRAMLITSIVLSLGFLVYIKAQMTIMVGFGVITAGCIVLALVASYLLGPALMVLANKPRQITAAGFENRAAKIVQSDYEPEVTNS